MIQPGAGMLQPYLLAPSSSTAPMHTPLPAQPFVYHSESAGSLCHVRHGDFMHRNLV